MQSCMSQVTFNIDQIQIKKHILIIMIDSELFYLKPYTRICSNLFKIYNIDYWGGGRGVVRETIL